MSQFNEKHIHPHDPLVYAGDPHVQKQLIQNKTLVRIQRAPFTFIYTNV